MRVIRQDWRDLFGGFKIAFDVWKLVLAFLGLGVTVLCLWAMQSMPAPLTTSLLAGLVVVGLLIRFATSDTGLTVKKTIGLFGVAAILAGLTVLLSLMPGLKATEDSSGVIVPVCVIFVLVLIWSFFGGAISRIAVVELSTDDRLGIGEAVCYAGRKYTAYLGAVLLPFVAVSVFLFGCFLFGLLFRLPVVNIILSLFFFLVLIAGFMATLVALGAVAGTPLMLPAVSAEGNDAFDAISRSYSYVYGRPWRFLFYNLVAFIYGVACVFFVTIFVLGILWLSTSALSVGSGEVWDEHVAPRVLAYVNPLVKPVESGVEQVASTVASMDPTDVVGNLCKRAMWQVQGWVQRLEPSSQGFRQDSPAGTTAAAVIIAIPIYGLVGLLFSYIVSLLFSLQSQVYLLLRRVVDGADTTEVYLEEDLEEGELWEKSATPEKVEGQDA